MTERNIRWRIYHCGLSFFALLGRPEIFGPNFRSVDRLAPDVAHEKSDDFPRVIIVEPSYGDAPHIGNDIPNRATELGKRRPEVRWYPEIISFLENTFLPEASTPGEAIRRRRMQLGMSAKALAKAIGIDCGTVIHAERNGRTKSGRVHDIEAVLLKLEVAMNKKSPV